LSVRRVQQICLRDLADYLQRATGRTLILEAGDARNCEVAHIPPAGGEVDIAGLANEQAVIIGIFSDKSGWAGQLGSLVASLARGALLLMAVPDPDPGPDLGERFPRAFLDHHTTLLHARNLPPVYVGRILDMGGKRWIVSLHDPAITSAIKELASQPHRPLAILAAYNESDVISEVVLDLLDQGCDVAAIDNWSNDGTWEIIKRLKQLHSDRIHCERFPSDGPARYYEWKKILIRKEEIALSNPGRWIIHTDADEIRRSPFANTTLAQGLMIASHLGANRVSFNLINFRPVENIENATFSINNMRYFEFGDQPGHFVQAKAWFQGAARVDLSNSGGHVARFPSAVEFPYKFLLKHYPIRSQWHGMRKVHIDRRARWSPFEREKLRWHSQYDRLSEWTDFIWPKDKMEYFDEEFWENYGILVFSDLMKDKRRQEQSVNGERPGQDNHGRNKAHSLETEEDGHATGYHREL